MENVKQIVIVGPTASGKTSLSIDLATKLNGEIISADSRAIYKGLDIGTAKPSLQERRSIKHYGFDLIYPDKRFSSMQFKEYANEKVATIRNNKKLPLVVGGSGLYIDSYIFDFRPPKVNNNDVRTLDSWSIEKLKKEITILGYKMPENSNNKLHLINAMLRKGKEPVRNESLPDGCLMVGIRPSRQLLLEQISSRAQEMFERGILEEAAIAFDKYGYYAPGLRGGIYAELVEHFKNGVNLKTIKENFIRSDMQLAKRQITWFKRNKYIKWFDSAIEAKKYFGLIN